MGVLCGKSPGKEERTGGSKRMKEGNNSRGGVKEEIPSRFMSRQRQREVNLHKLKTPIYKENGKLKGKTRYERKKK